MTRLTLLALLAVAGCSTAPDPPAGPPASQPPSTDPAPVVDPDAPFASEEDYRQQRAEADAALEAAIVTEAGTAGACRVVATSEQACGGPTTFAVYSAESSDRAEVERLAARLVALDAKANAQFEWASTCMAYEPPTPVLRAGRCVASR